MSHVDSLTKKEYSKESVDAFILKNAIDSASHSYVTPVPGANKDSFLRDAKDTLKEHLGRLVNDPLFNKDHNEGVLKLSLDSKKWSESEKDGVYFGYLAAVRSIEESRQFLVDFDKSKSLKP